MKKIKINCGICILGKNTSLHIDGEEQFCMLREESLTLPHVVFEGRKLKLTSYTCGGEFVDKDSLAFQREEY